MHMKTITVGLSKLMARGMSPCKLVGHAVDIADSHYAIIAQNRQYIRDGITALYASLMFDELQFKPVMD